MKAAFLALAASALLGSAAAGSLHDRRHAHQAFHLRRDTAAPVDSATCTCTTYVTTIYGEASCQYPSFHPIILDDANVRRWSMVDV